MRIVLDLQACQSIESRCRGIGRYSLAFSQELVRQAQQHEIWIALSGRFPDTIKPLRAIFEEFIPRERIAVFETLQQSAEVNPANVWRARVSERLRESFLARLNPDIVHVSSLFEGFSDDAVTSTSSLENLPTAVTLYDLIPYLNSESYLADEAVENWYLRKLANLLLADRCLAISEHSRQEAIGALGLDPDKVVTISSDADQHFRPIEIFPAEEQRFRNRFSLTRPFVMYTGGIDIRKNIDRLLQAFSQLPPDVRSKHQLAVVCKISLEERKRLLSLGRRAGLDEGEIVFTDYVTEEELVSLYNLCKLFVFPSLHEGFGLPALEAMRCGAPVIGSNRSSIPEVIGLNEALFDPESSKCIADKIYQGLTDEGFRAKLINHGRCQQARFSWKESASRTLEAFEEVHLKQSAKASVQVSTWRERPRLAYVSPLPPERSGIADYSTELLPQLAQYYNIDLITDVSDIEDPWCRANFRKVSLSEFKQHAGGYDRILYHFGNSPLHGHMHDLLQRFPGVVVLHDFFLSHLERHLGYERSNPFWFSQRLFTAHGYPALEFFQKQGEEKTVWQYPCSLTIFEQSLGVILHSEYAKTLALDWYGAELAHQLRVVPLLRKCPTMIAKEQARKILGYEESDIVVCCFGALGESKLNHEIFDAWAASFLSEEEKCHLIFVGGGEKETYGKQLQQKINSCHFRSKVHITGYVGLQTYRDYLAAADIGIQLRSKSRGETSAAVLDCLAYEVATIVNIHGASAELPEQAIVRISESAPREELIRALETLVRSPEKLKDIARRGRKYVCDKRSPGLIAKEYRDAIEGFGAHHPAGRQTKLIGSLKRLSCEHAASERDLISVVQCMNENDPKSLIRQLFVDISVLVQSDAKSGIQRVVRSILSILLIQPPDGYRVEPVYRDGACYRYAREFSIKFMGLNNAHFDNPAVDVDTKDIFLGLDLDAGMDDDGRQWIQHHIHRGMRAYFVIYDLLPVRFKEHFPSEITNVFENWLRGVCSFATGLVCISKAVADELRKWLEEVQISGGKKPGIEYFHLGADINSSKPTIGFSSKEKDLLKTLDGLEFFLMVGTIEPRKGHQQVLEAMERLWEKGLDSRLVIVGKCGWKTDDICKKILKHEKFLSHLFWLDNASDEMLLLLYDKATALIQASEGEGFGLPLIEAAQHKLPVIARDIPVFREVAGSHAHYFKGKSSEDLAQAIQTWICLNRKGLAPCSDDMPWLTWKQSTMQLLDIVLNEKGDHRPLSLNG